MVFELSDDERAIVVTVNELECILRKIDKLVIEPGCKRLTDIFLNSVIFHLKSECAYYNSMENTK